MANYNLLILTISSLVSFVTLLGLAFLSGT
jgi:hypothetical protein